MTIKLSTDEVTRAVAEYLNNRLGGSSRLQVESLKLVQGDNFGAEDYYEVRTTPETLKP